MPTLLRPHAGLFLTPGSGTDQAADPVPSSEDGLVVTQQIRVAATASASDTTISVDLLAATVPAGTVLRFSGGTSATLTAQANAGDASLTVTALTAGIAAGETASGSVNLINLKRVSPVMPAPTLTNGRPQATWQPTSTTVANWGTLQVLVGPKGSTATDITYFRHAPVEVQSWSSADPFGDATAVLRLPQWTPFDTVPGSGTTAWLVKGALVAIKKVDPTGFLTTTLWEGTLMSWDVDQNEKSGSLTLTCRGALLQIADFKRAPGVSDLPNSLDDLFRLQYNTSSGVRPSLNTNAPIVVGGPSDITSRTKSSFEDSALGFLQNELAKAVENNGLDAWTIAITRPRTPTLKLRDRTTVHWTVTTGTPGVGLRLSQDYTQAPNVVYMESQDEAGSTVRNLFVDPDTNGPFFEPFGFDPAVHNIYIDETTGVPYTSGTVDTGIPRVERYINAGEGINRADLIRLGPAYVARDSDPGWFGTITLRIDPEEGSRFEMAAGQNIKVKHFAGSGSGGTLFHIAACEVNLPQLQVTLTVDTKARDLLALEEIIKRNRAGTSPGRQLRAGRQSGITNDRIVPWDNGAGAGWVPTARKFDGTSTVSLTANTWTVVRWLAASGPATVIRSEARCSTSTQFGMYVFDWNITTGNLPTDPFAHVDTWASPPVGYIVGWGVKNQRGGYSPGAETRLDDTGAVINTDPVTGVLIDETPWDIPARRGTAQDVAGSSSNAAVPPYLYLAVYALATCTFWCRFTHGAV